MRASVVSRVNAPVWKALALFCLAGGASTRVSAQEETPLPEGLAPAGRPTFERLFVEPQPVYPGETVTLSIRGQIDANHLYRYEEECKKFLFFDVECHMVLRNYAAVRSQAEVPMLLRLTTQRDLGTPAVVLHQWTPRATFTLANEEYWVPTARKPDEAFYEISVGTPDKKATQLQNFTSAHHVWVKISDRVGSGGVPLNRNPCPLASAGTCSSGQLSARFVLEEKALAPRVDLLAEYLALGRRDVDQIIGPALVDPLMQRFPQLRARAVDLLFAHTEKYYPRNPNAPSNDRQRILAFLYNLDSSNSRVLTALSEWHLDSGDFLTAEGLNKDAVRLARDAWDQARARGETTAAEAIKFADSLNVQGRITSDHLNQLRGRDVIAAIGLGEQSAKLYHDALCERPQRQPDVEQKLAGEYRRIAELRRALGGQWHLEAAESALRRAQQWLPRTEKGALRAVSANGAVFLVDHPTERQPSTDADLVTEEHVVPPLGSRLIATSADLSNKVFEVSPRRWAYQFGATPAKTLAAPDVPLDEKWRLLGISSAAVFAARTNGEVYAWPVNGAAQKLTLAASASVMLSETRDAALVQEPDALTATRIAPDFTLASQTYSTKDLPGQAVLLNATTSDTGVLVAAWYRVKDGGTQTVWLVEPKDNAPATDTQAGTATDNASDTPLSTTMHAWQLDDAGSGGPDRIVPAAQGSRFALALAKGRVWFLDRTQAAAPGDDPPHVAPINLGLPGLSALDAKPRPPTVQTGGWLVAPSDRISDTVLAISINDGTPATAAASPLRLSGRYVFASAAWHESASEHGTATVLHLATLEHPRAALDALVINTSSSTPLRSTSSVMSDASLQSLDLSAHPDQVWVLTTPQTMSQGKPAGIAEWQPSRRRFAVYAWPNLETTQFTVTPRLPETARLEWRAFRDSTIGLLIGRSADLDAAVSEIIRVDTAQNTAVALTLPAARVASAAPNAADIPAQWQFAPLPKGLTQSDAPSYAFCSRPIDALAPSASASVAGASPAQPANASAPELATTQPESYSVRCLVIDPQVSGGAVPSFDVTVRNTPDIAAVIAMSRDVKTWTLLVRRADDSLVVQSAVHVPPKDKESAKTDLVVWPVGTWQASEPIALIRGVGDNTLVLQKRPNQNAARLALLSKGNPVDCGDLCRAPLNADPQAAVFAASDLREFGLIERAGDNRDLAVVAIRSRSDAQQFTTVRTPGGTHAAVGSDADGAKLWLRAASDSVETEVRDLTRTDGLPYGGCLEAER